MEIKDHRGRAIDEVVIRLSDEEMADLFVAISQVDDGSSDHVFLRDRGGATLAIYHETEGRQPLERGSDWWVGPILLFVLVLLVAGAFSVARSILNLLF